MYVLDAWCVLLSLQVQHPVVGFDGCLMTSPAPASISPAFVLSPYGNLTERLHICPEFQRGQCSADLCPFAHPGERVSERQRERERERERERASKQADRGV